MKKKFLPEFLTRFFQWFFVALIIGIVVGTVSAFFLRSLAWVTDWREAHVWIIALLPVGGFFVGWVYHQMGKSVEKGNNLLLDEIHDPKSKIPLRMAPMILASTLLTHFFGGSAGREGVAVQVGGCLADQIGLPFRFSKEDRKKLLMAGMSAGFASVFGTPWAGAIFGIEVLVIGKLQYKAVFPCLVAAFVGSLTTLAWGIHHDTYLINLIPGISVAAIFYTILAGAIFGITGMIFAGSVHGLTGLFNRFIKYGPMRPFVGGCVIALLVLLVGSTRYIGLGTHIISQSFLGKLPPWDFFGKYIFTVLTLGSGFKGGEVTPLFYIGATLGNALSYVLALPTPLLAALGFVAVFAGAANTPLTCTILAMEVFGPSIGFYAAITCLASFLFSGHVGIYHSQKTGRTKPFFKNPRN